MMLLGSSKSCPLNANARKSMPWLGKKIKKKLYGMYNLLKYLLEEFTLKNNFSRSHNILLEMVLDQENVLDVSLFACFPQIIKL